MEFFELGIGRIHQLISEWFSFSVQQGLLFALFSLLLSLLLLFFCKKYNLLKRENKFWRVFARSYYFYIPFIFIVCGFAIGLSLATKDFFVTQTKTSITPLMKFVFPSYQSHVNTQWARVIQTRMSFNQTVDEYVDEIVFTPRKDEFTEVLSTYAANFMVPRITRWGIESVVTSARDIALRQAEDQGYLETQKVKALMIVHSLSTFNYPPGFWDDVNKGIEEKTGVFFMGMSGNILLIFFFLMIFPFAEIILYRIVSARKIKKAIVIMKRNQIGKMVHEHTGEVVEEIERIPGERAPAYVDIEIPKVYEN